MASKPAQVSAAKKTTKTAAKTPKKIETTPLPVQAAPAPAPKQTKSPEIVFPTPDSAQNLVLSDTHAHPSDDDLHKNLTAALVQHEKTITDPNAPKRPTIGLDDPVPALQTLPQPKLEIPANYAEPKKPEELPLPPAPQPEEKDTPIVLNEQGLPKEPSKNETPSADSKITPPEIGTNTVEDSAKADSETLAKLYADKVGKPKIEQEDKPLNLSQPNGENPVPPPAQGEEAKEESGNFDLPTVLMSYAQENYHEGGFSFDFSKFALAFSFFGGIITTIAFIYFFNYIHVPLPLLKGDATQAAVMTPTIAPNPLTKTKIATGAAQPKMQQFSRSEVKLRVLNGSLTPGAAASISAKLKTAGYQIASTGNATSSAYLFTQIRTKIKDASISAQLIKDLNPELHASATADLKDNYPADAEIIIGKN